MTADSPKPTPEAALATFPHPLLLAHALYWRQRAVRAEIAARHVLRDIITTHVVTKEHLTALAACLDDAAEEDA